jgi:hypothetical protein
MIVAVFDTYPFSVIVLSANDGSILSQYSENNYVSSPTVVSDGVFIDSSDNIYLVA